MNERCCLKCMPDAHLPHLSLRNLMEFAVDQFHEFVCSIWLSVVDSREQCC